MLKKVLGIETGINKKSDLPFTVLHTETEFDAYSIEKRNAIGKKCETTYIRSLVDCKIGDMVEFEYQPGFNNEAVVAGVKIRK